MIPTPRYLLENQIKSPHLGLEHMYTRGGCMLMYGKTNIKKNNNEKNCQKKKKVHILDLANQKH